MDLSMKNLSMFQTTTFENGVRFVFINLWGNYKALRQALENVINSKDKRFSSDGRSKAAGEEAVRHTIDSWIFCLTLSGCADTYNLYGLFAYVSQQVNILPHTRYYQAQTWLRSLPMMRSIDHLNYPVSSDNKKTACGHVFIKI